MPSLPHPVRFQSPVPSILSFRPLSPSPSLSTPKGSIFNNDSDNPFTMISPAFRHLESVESAYKAALSNTHHRCSNNVQPASEHDYYLRQQRPIEVIQLVEVAPPSRKHGSIPCSSSAASSSYASTSSSEDEEESYCSSEDSESDEESTPRRVIPGSFTACMRRIEHWRDTYAKAVGAEFAPSPSRTKRKNDEEVDEDDDTLSRSSKRSRQSSLSIPTSTSTEASVRSVHSCSACDAWFPDRGSLRKHGIDPLTNEACRAAVEYDFES